MKKLWLAALCALLLALPFAALCETGGSCGEGIAWTMNEDGLLTITGEGPMADYDENDVSPFRELDVRKIAVARRDRHWPERFQQLL